MIGSFDCPRDDLPGRGNPSRDLTLDRDWPCDRRDASRSRIRRDKEHPATIDRLSGAQWRHRHRQRLSEGAPQGRHLTRSSRHRQTEPRRLEGSGIGGANPRPSSLILRSDRAPYIERRAAR